MLKTFELHTQQRKALQSKARFIAMITGIQGGKTTTGCFWTMDGVSKFPGDDFLIAAPTYKILQQSTLRKFFELFPELRRFYKAQDQVIMLPNGTHIYIRSTEDPDAIEGMTLRRAWLDEGGQMKERAWINTQGRTSILQGQVLVTTTPYFLNWLYNDFYKSWQDNNPDFEVIQYQSSDNPWFPNVEQERAKGQMKVEDYERRYLGLFRQLRGLVHSWFEPKYIVDEVPPDEKIYEIMAGIDWGFSRPTGALWLAFAKSGNIYIIDEYYKAQLSIQQNVENIKSIDKNHKATYFFADPEDPEAIMNANQAKLRVVPASKPVAEGLEAVRKYGIKGNIWVLRKCTNFIDEIQTYHYPEPQEDKFVKDEPVRVNNHLMDCIRYIIYTFVPTPPVAPLKRGDDPIWEYIRADMKGKNAEVFNQEALDDWSQDDHYI